MANRTRRIAISVDEDTHAKLKAFCELTGDSMASYLHQLLMSSMPTLDSVMVLIERANDLDEEARDLLLSQMQARTDALSDLINESLDMASNTPQCTSVSAVSSGEVGDKQAPLAFNKGVRSKIKTPQFRVKSNKNIYLASSRPKSSEGGQ